MRTTILIAACVLTAGAAMAGNWYTGIDAGYIEQQYHASYTYTEPGHTPDKYLDHAYGVEVNMLGGYRFELHERVSLSAQVRASANDAEWNLFIPDEPSYLEYESPYAVFLSLVPAIRIVSQAEVFGELGIGQGYVKEEKVSPIGSSYDYSGWENAYVWGFGLRCKVSERVGLFAEYRHAGLDEFCYKSCLPDGRHWETVKDEPESSVYSVGVTCEF